MICSEEIIIMIEETMELKIQDKEKAATLTLNEIGLDSLDSLEFLHMIQDRYDLNIKGDKYNTFMNLSPSIISDLINKKQFS
jgi:acyl carrier protein